MKLDNYYKNEGVGVGITNIYFKPKLSPNIFSSKKVDASLFLHKIRN
jgi:hypothetical protein